MADWDAEVRIQDSIHFVEYRHHGTDKTHWKKFNRQPKMSDMYLADTVVRQNADGTCEYVKNVKTGELRQLTEDEAMWVILHV